MVKTVAGKSCEPVSSASIQVLVVLSTFCNPNPNREYNPGKLNMTLSLPYRVLARCQGTRCPNEPLLLYQNPLPSLPRSTH